MTHKLSIWETVDAWLGWLSVGAALVRASACGPFRGASGADTYHHHLIQAVVKKLTSQFSPLQIQYLFPSYEQIYLQYCQKNSIEPHFVRTKGGATGFWIGSPSAKYVVINFHGGFAMDATKPYLDFWPGVPKALADNGIEMGWFHCTYTLTPHARYPTQFREAVEALRHVVEDLGRSPSEVILTGDSAGGNLCLAVLSHLTHPCPDAPELTVKEPLKAIVLMSPWVSFREDWPSVERNRHRDIDDPEVTAKVATMYLDGHQTSNYIEAVEASEEWWSNAKVEQTLVLAGEDEILLDPIRAWTRKFRKSNPDTSLVVGRGECHVAPLIWPLFGDNHETQQGLALKEWLCGRLHMT